MKKAILIFLFLFSVNAFAQTDSNSAKRELPADFVSDGCTFFPDGKYYDCCVAHDEAYYFGGSFKERRRADGQLFECVAAKKGFYPKIVAPVMWAGVRIGGFSFLPTPFHWGFGKSNLKNKAEKIVPKSKCPNK